MCSEDDDDVSRPQKPAWKRLLLGHLPLEKETATFILISMLDVFMTYILLRSNEQGGGFHFIESNPLARYFINHWGEKGMLYFKMAMTAFVCVLTQIIALKRPGTAEKVLKLGTLIVGCVVIYSLVLFVRHR